MSRPVLEKIYTTLINPRKLAADADSGTITKRINEKEETTKEEAGKEPVKVTPVSCSGVIYFNGYLVTVE